MHSPCELAHWYGCGWNKFQINDSRSLEIMFLLVFRKPWLLILTRSTSTTTRGDFVPADAWQYRRTSRNSHATSQVILTLINYYPNLQAALPFYLFLTSFAINILSSLLIKSFACVSLNLLQQKLKCLYTSTFYVPLILAVSLRSSLTTSLHRGI